MQQLDERILEHLEEEDWSSPSIMASRPEFQRLGVSKAAVRERCRVLTSVDLVAPVHRGMVEITTWGKRYLEGELDTGHLRPRQDRAAPLI